MSNSSDVARLQKKILVVEDDPLNMKLFQTLLMLDGHAVTECGDAESALASAKQSAPDLIIMDIQLPGMSGLEAIEVLKADDHTRGVPVLAVTGYSLEEDRERCMAAGFDAFLTKPLDRSEFLASVRHYLGL